MRWSAGWSGLAFPDLKVPGGFPGGLAALYQQAGSTAWGWCSGWSGGVVAARRIISLWDGPSAEGTPRKDHHQQGNSQGGVFHSLLS